MFKSAMVGVALLMSMVVNATSAQAATLNSHLHATVSCSFAHGQNHVRAKFINRSSETVIFRVVTRTDVRAHRESKVQSGSSDVIPINYDASVPAVSIRISTPYTTKPMPVLSANIHLPCSAISFSI